LAHPRLSETCGVSSDRRGERPLREKPTLVKDDAGRRPPTIAAPTAYSHRIVLATDRDSNRKFREPIIRDAGAATRSRVTGRDLRPTGCIEFQPRTPAPAHTGGECVREEPRTPLILREELSWHVLCCVAA
jgi:hypothetical protein